MTCNATELNLSGTKLQVLAYILLAEAADVEAAQKSLQDSKLKETLSDRADRLNISGNWLVLLSDIILGIAAYAEASESSDAFPSLATRLNLADVWVSILSDILALAAAIEATKK